MEKKKRIFVQIQCSEEQRDGWKSKADQAGHSLSDLLRIALDETKPKRRRRVDVDPNLIRELARIGNNLNQVAKWANQQKSAVQAVEVVAHLSAIEDELSSLRSFIEGSPDAD
ncbi:MobC family plasmid mobilization relaxosome protein [Pseudovibrio ascidiaceicola]|uniref:MobC family plasmid mobilization relaxosome protein n=1 Tax=Pseudovibrio ascidiaceicola TaxID=285279 RepID=UPI003D368C62